MMSHTDLLNPRIFVLSVFLAFVLIIFVSTGIDVFVFVLKVFVHIEIKQDILHYNYCLINLSRYRALVR